MKRLAVILFVTLFVTNFLFAQAENDKITVGEKWIQLIKMNSQFKDPNKIKLGDKIWVSIQFSKTTHVGPDEGRFFIASHEINSLWKAAEEAIKEGEKLADEIVEALNSR